MVMGEKFSEKGTQTYYDIGYIVAYEVYDYRLEVQVYKLCSLNLYHTKDGFGLTESLADAELFIEGSIKWDGCSNWTLNPEPNHMQHFCGREGLEKFGQLLLRLWDLAADKVPHSDCERGQ